MATGIDSYAGPSDSAISEIRRIVLNPDASIADQLSAAEVEVDASGVCLDFANIEIVSSAELSALIRFSLRMRQLELSIVMSHVGPDLQQIFEITRFGVWSTS